MERKRTKMKIFKWDEINGQDEGTKMEAFLTAINDTFAIMQLREGEETRPMRFISYEALQRSGNQPEIDRYELVYVAEGELVQHFETGSFHYLKGDACFLNPNTRHCEGFESDCALFFVTPSSGDYFRATAGYLELDLCGVSGISQNRNFIVDAFNIQIC